jgi:hypothetical protein
MSAFHRGSALVLLAFVVLACLQPSLADGEVRLATSAEGAFDVGCPAALIEGTLWPDDGSGTAIRNASGSTPVIWPFDYTAREAGGVIEVLDASGDVVARTGEMLSLGGGYITADDRWSTCGLAPLHQ